MSFVTKAWNKLNWRRKAAVFWCLRSFPDSDLAAATEGQLVKITGRFSTDFYITDRKSGIRAMVKAGSGCKVVPLIVESKLVTTRQCRTLSSHLRKWLQERNLSAEARLLRLEEGYVQEGSFVTVIGVLRRNNDISMIVQPQELFSTGCLWQKLLLPVDVDGLILGFPDTAGPNMNPEFAVNFLPNIARKQVACKPRCSGVRWISVRDECPPAAPKIS
ncbi:uncharacterized membrane protein At1g16860-like [Populus trichocarpa]|uniref:uncharacterized membrane protein At1g16860-like n=1 Tax=Populus trichocarpa TaxID=3694 RepID=UPI00227794CF|nr:uncharacterized membrane protein At1g16860-like [Populus trichocarpa]